MTSLCPTFDRGEEIYQAAATEVQNYNRATSPDQTWRFTRALVRNENLRLASDPLHARAQRRFTLHKPDEHGGAKFSGYVTPEIGADLISDYFVVHSHTGAVKSLVTAHRSVYFYQRIAFLAEQLVCQYPGCDERVSRCDGHHVAPWSQCQETALANMGLMCRKHHSQNRDDRSGPHMTKNEHGCQWHDRDGIFRNESPAAQKAAGRRLTQTQR